MLAGPAKAGKLWGRVAPDLQTARSCTGEKACNLLYRVDDPAPAALQRWPLAGQPDRRFETATMDPSAYLTVSSRLAIPRSELSFRATRAGGAGGQHVNTSSTRIELLWDLTRSTAVDEEERERLRTKLASRLDSDGMLRVVASDRRSQRQNRIAAEERLVALVRRALVVPKKRRATRPTRAAKERRLAEKKRQSEKKRERRVDDVS